MGLLAKLRSLGRFRPAQSADLPLVQPGQLRVISTRDDGLCMRINTILDAALVARAYGGTYGFHWDEAETPAIDQQTTSSALAVFEAGFLAGHRLSDGLIVDAPDLYAPPRTAEDLAARLAAGRSAGVLYLDQPRNFTSFLPDVLTRLPPAHYASAFAALGFSDAARRGIEAARRVDVHPGSVAIHLRGGDILHGTHSHMGTYLHKAPSVPEIAAQIERLAAAQTPVWLIGQEPDVQLALARVYPQVRAFGSTDNRPDLGDVGDVLFDAVLMSQMAWLYGGNSGVTLLSRRLGDVPFTDMAQSGGLVSLNELLTDPMAAPTYAGVAATSRAHAYAKAVIAARPSEWQAHHLDLIRLAQAHRPQGKFLPLVEICVMVGLGQLDPAEALAQDWLTLPLAGGIDPQIGYAFLLGRDHYFPMSQAAPFAGRLADDSRPALALIASLAGHFADPKAVTKPMVLAALAGVEAMDPQMQRIIRAGLDVSPS